MDQFTLLGHLFLITSALLTIPPGRATIGCTSETVSQICRFLNCLSAISVSMLFDSALWSSSDHGDPKSLGIIAWYLLDFSNLVYHTDMTFPHPQVYPLRVTAVVYKSLRECGILLRLPTSRGKRGGRVRPRSSGGAEIKTHLGLVNACSLTKRSELITDLISTTRIDVLAITESWLTIDHGDTDLIAMCPIGYSAIHSPRRSTKVESVEAAAWPSCSENLSNTRGWVNSQYYYLLNT